MNRQSPPIITIILSVCMTVALFVGCSQPDPILIGFSGQMSGAYADLGIKSRDSVILAVEQINAGGGIHGRLIKLLVRDDQGTPGGAVTADKELLDAGVVVIIGHMTSGQTMAAVKVSADAGVVMMSPLASTVKLSGMEDHFFRMVSTSTNEARSFARYISENRGISTIAIILDTDNAAYTQNYLRAFADVYQALGRKLAGQWDFSSSSKPDFNHLAQEIADVTPGGLLILASPLDAAHIAQKLRAVDQKTALFCSGWAQTEVLLQNGGRAVEGLEVCNDFDSNSPNPAFKKFRSQYLEKFGHEPGFAGSFSYEAMLVLAKAFKKTNGQAEGLREALLETRDFPGLVGTFSLDQYGDAVRPYFLHRVKNGKFVNKGSISREPIKVQ